MLVKGATDITEDEPHVMSCVIKYRYNTIFSKIHTTETSYVTQKGDIWGVFFKSLTPTALSWVCGRNLRLQQLTWRGVVHFILESYITFICRVIWPRKNPMELFVTQNLTFNPNEIMSLLPLSRNTRFVSTLQRTGVGRINQYLVIIFWGNELDNWKLFYGLPFFSMIRINSLYIMWYIYIYIYIYRMKLVAIETSLENLWQQTILLSDFF